MLYICRRKLILFRRCFSVDLWNASVIKPLPLVRHQKDYSPLKFSQIRHYRTDASENSETNGWWSRLSFAQKQILIWSGGFLACSVVAVVNWYTHASKISQEDMLERAEQIKRNGVLGTLVKARGVRNSMMVGMIGGAVSWVATYLFTNNPRHAAKVMCAAMAILPIGFWFLHVLSSPEDLEEKDLKSALKKKRLSEDEEKKAH